MGLDPRENLSSGFVISTFVFHLLESIIKRLSTSKIQILLLVSVDKQACLSMTWLETQKTGFLMSRPI